MARITLQTFGQDKYERTIADVFLPAGTNVNHMLARDGWRYRKYAPSGTVLEGLEKEAREAKKGVGGGSPSSALLRRAKGAAAKWN